MTLPCGAFGKFASFMNDDVEEFYTNSISNQSRCTSFEAVFLGSSAIFGGGFRYRIGLGFVDFVVQNLSGYWMDPIPILCQIAPLELVFFVQVLKKLRSRLEHP